MAMRERKKVVTFEPGDVDDESILGHGIGVSGGAMSGRLVFTLEEIDKWRNLEPDTPLILIRGDTVPDDIKEIYAADGLLTAQGRGDLPRGGGGPPAGENRRGGVRQHALR